MKLLLLFMVMSPFKDIDDPTPKQIDSLFNQSKTYWYNNRDSAYLTLNNVLSLSRKTHYLKGEANALKGLGFLSYSNTEALHYYVRALEIRQQIGDSLGIGVSLADISSVYAKLKNKPMTLDYLNRSLEIRKRINDNGGIALCLIGLGTIDRNAGKVTESLAKFREALVYRRKHGEVNGIAYAHINIAYAFLNLKQYDSALVYQTLAHDEFEKAKNYANNAWVAFVGASAHFHLKQYDESEAALASVLNKDRSLNEIFMGDCLLLQAKIYEVRKQYPEALAVTNAWLRHLENQKENDDNQQARQLAADFEFKVKQDEQAKLDAVAYQKKKRRDNLQFLLIAVVLTLAFVGIIFLRRRASARVLDTAIFLVFIFLFEFLIVLIDPALQSWIGSAPLLILFCNAIIAVALSPLHHLMMNTFSKMVKKEAVQ